MSGLHVNNLSHAFGPVEVVKNVSVTVQSGELVCLLGPSGCGKTTLLRVAAGLEDLQSGEVYISEQLVAEGKAHLNLPPEKRGIGLMFQDYALFPHLTVAQNILFGVKSKTSRRKWMEAALQEMSLSPYADAYPHTLSGGQQQRVALLRAIAPEPGVLFLDEPFSGLDVTRRTEIRKQTLGFLKETGVATLMVTHDPDEAMYMADKILVMNNGEMIQDGTPDNIYFHPNSPFVTDLFGAANRLNATVENGRINTALGSFETNSFEEGSAVVVLIRADGIRLAPEGETPSALDGDTPWQAALPNDQNKGPANTREPGFVVVSAHSLGKASHIVIRVPDCNGEPVNFDVRVPGIFLPTEGTRVAAILNVKDTHIFKVNS